MRVEKKEILESLSPKAILIPLTNEATESIVLMNNHSDMIPILKFPFRVGKESRVDSNEKGFFLKFRLFKSKNDAEPNNDAYLIDKTEESEISKEHFQIERTNNFYLLRDRESKKGTTINNITYGGDNSEIEQVLNDGDIIQVGSCSSKFKFQFLILEM